MPPIPSHGGLDAYVARMERDGDLSGMVDYVQRFQADPDTVKAAMQGITEYALKRPNTEDAAVGKMLGPALPYDKVAAAIDTLVEVYLRERHDGE